MNNSTNITLSVFDRYPTNMDFRLKFLVLTSTVHRWSMPFIIITGIIGNFISLLVWTKRKIRRNNSSATYLAALSFSDLIMLHFYTLYYLKFSWRIRIIDYTIICQVFQMIHLWFQYNPSPLVFAFTLERWIAVCYPLKRESWCTNKRAYLAIIVICIFMVPLCLVQSFGWSTDNPRHVCAFKDSWQQSMLVNIFSTVVEFLMSAGFPICTLVFNILVVLELQNIARNPLKHDLTKRTSTVQYNKVETRKKISIFTKKQTILSDDMVHENEHHKKDDVKTVLIHNDNIKHNASRNIKSVHKTSTASGVNFRSTTIMLLSVSFYQIFTTLPTGAVYLAQFFVIPGNDTLSDIEIINDPQWSTFFSFQTMKEFIDLFALTHYSFNVLIYLLTGRQFRRYLIQTLKFDKLCINPSNHEALTEQNSKNLSQVRLSSHGGINNNNVIVNPHSNKHKFSTSCQNSK